MPFVRSTLKCLIPNKYDFEPKTIGQHLLKHRLSLDLTQGEVGKLFNVSSNTIYNWEKGHTDPQIFQIPILIKFLGYDPLNSVSHSIAEHLQHKRLQLGLTQKMAARKLGIDPCTWSSWECGGTIMTHKHRRLVAEFLEMDEEIIFEKMRRQWNERHWRE